MKWKIRFAMEINEFFCGKKGKISRISREKKFEREKEKNLFFLKNYFILFCAPEQKWFKAESLKFLPIELKPESIV